MNSLKHVQCVSNAFAAFQRFYYDHMLIPYELEYSVFGNGWAGTMDFKGRLDD